MTGQGGESGVCVLFWKGIHCAPPIRLNYRIKKAGIRRLHLIRRARLSPGWCHPCVASEFRSRYQSPQ
ncbi:Uncharacterised protein [Shigella sonnei]|nr:Uncharacterised protein [Shigella sonnei]